MRKLSLGLALALSLAAIAALHAQTSPPATGEHAQTSQSANGNGKDVTVTGCLERAVRNPALDTGNAVGTSGSTSASSTDEPIIRSDTKWVLTEPSKKASGAKVGTSGRAPTVEYRLDIADESNLAAHEGHKVQLTGTVEEGQSAAAGSGEAKRSASHRAPLLKINSVKMISEQCPQ